MNIWSSCVKISSSFFWRDRPQSHYCCWNHTAGSNLITFYHSQSRIEQGLLSKIISKRRELVKLCNIKRSSPVFCDRMYSPKATEWWKPYDPIYRAFVSTRSSSSSRMHVMTNNWSAMKQRLHLVAEISRHSVLSWDRIRQCETSSESRQCL